MTQIQVGDLLPSCELFEGNPGQVVDICEIADSKRILVFSIVSAFSPACTETHFPGFVNRFDEFRCKGIEEVVCITVSDVFVASAFASQFPENDGKIRVLADPQASFTTMIGMDMILPSLGGLRSQRYVMLVYNNQVEKLDVEPDGVGLTCTLAENLCL